MTDPVGPSGQIFLSKRLFLAYFGHFLAPLVPHLGHSGSVKWPKPVCLNVLSAVPTSFQPCSNRFHKMYGVEAYLASFIIFGPISASYYQFWSVWAYFSAILTWIKSPTGQSGCLLLCSNLVPPLLTKNRLAGLICVAKGLF